MRKFLLTGPYFYAIAIIGFGITQIIIRNFLPELLPVPASLFAHQFWIYFTSVIFIGAAGCIIINKYARAASVLIAILFFIFLLYAHLPKLLSHPDDPTAWTPLFEVLAICSGAIIMAGIITPGFSIRGSWNTTSNKIFIVGKILFAVTLLIFGIQHFMYTAFIETLIPAWIPFHFLWLYIIEFAFIAVFISLIFNVQVYLATTLLGLMFLTWSLILHLPLVVTHLHVEAQWTSLFVAMAMCGTCFMIAGASSIKKVY